MQYFTEDFITFFKELSANNHKEWFHQNKRRYESSVKKPFTVFVGSMIKEIQKIDTDLSVEPKDCILRINRDIRFSKDKIPYNLHYTAFISRGGKKDKSIPGFFVRFSPEMVGIMGGCFGPDKTQLHKIRTRIKEDPKTFRELIEEQQFAQHFGTLKGEMMKRIPKEWQQAIEKEPLIANKQFYFVTEKPSDLILNRQLIEELMKYWRIMQPLNNYLTQAIQ